MVSHGNKRLRLMEATEDMIVENEELHSKVTESLELAMSSDDTDAVIKPYIASQVTYGSCIR